VDDGFDRRVHTPVHTRQERRPDPLATLRAGGGSRPSVSLLEAIRYEGLWDGPKVLWWHAQLRTEKRGVDEQRGRWRVSASVSKTKTGRWVNVQPVLMEAVSALVPRDDRVPDRPVFQGVRRLQAPDGITRACTAAGVPAFSPHDLRHRRISLLHLGGVPWARIGEHVGQRNLAVTANTYSTSLLTRPNSTTSRCSAPRSVVKDEDNHDGDEGQVHDHRVERQVPVLKTEPSR
jgi:integrase